MYNSWDVDLDNSSKAIKSIKNIIIEMIGGEIISLEDVKNNKIANILDIHSGIDYLRISKDGLTGIASRVQFGKPYNSFTVRFERNTGTKTEYEKRYNNIKKGYIYPYFTLQAYFDNKKNLNLLSIAIMKTEILYKQLEENNKVKKQKSDNYFKYIFWDDIESKESIIIKKFEQRYN